MVYYRVCVFCVSVHWCAQNVRRRVRRSPVGGKREVSSTHTHLPRVRHTSQHNAHHRPQLNNTTRTRVMTKCTGVAPKYAREIFDARRLEKRARKSWISRAAVGITPKKCAGMARNLRGYVEHCGGKMPHAAVGVLCGM